MSKFIKLSTKRTQHFLYSFEIDLSFWSKFVPVPSRLYSINTWEETVTAVPPFHFDIRGGVNDHLPWTCSCFPFLEQRVLKSTWRRWREQNLLSMPGVEPRYWNSFPIIELFLFMCFKLLTLKEILIITSRIVILWLIQLCFS